MSEKKDKLEDKITSLENIIAELESEGTSLERGIELFEKGVSLTRDCLAELGRSKGRITELKRRMDELTEVPYDTDEDK